MLKARYKNDRIYQSHVLFYTHHDSNEASVIDLRVDGSLIVESDSVLGQPGPALPVGSNAIRARDQQFGNTDLWYVSFAVLLLVWTRQCCYCWFWSSSVCILDKLSGACLLENGKLQKRQ